MANAVLNSAPFVSTSPTVSVQLTKTHFCLIKIFSKLVGKATLRSTCKSSLPPLKFRSQKTVFLDLDETLIHTVSATPRSNYDFIVERLVKGERRVYYVLKRPFVDEFLQFLSEKNFQIVIFTAGYEKHVSPVLDKLDPKGLIAHRLYQDSCKILNGKLVKDISCFGRDLNRVVIIDDKPRFCRLQPENAILIKPFIDDLEDDELNKLMNYFKENKFLPKKKELTTVHAPSCLFLMKIFLVFLLMYVILASYFG